MHKKLLVLVLFLVLGCQNLPGPKNPPTGEFCEAAEKNLLRLQCEINGEILGSPNKVGERYRDICLRVEKEGAVSMVSECFVTARTCEEVETCNTRN